MKPCNLLRYLVVSVLAVLVFPPQVFCEHVGSPAAAQGATAESCLNTSDGLRQLLLDLLRLARSGDQAKLQVEIAAMKIPDYKNWFVHAFGQEQGQRLGDRYGQSLEAGESHFEMLWAELARQQGVISVDRVRIPSGAQDAYRADWKKTDDSTGPDSQSIGVFYFVDGQFRLDGSHHDVRILSTNKTGR